MIANALRPPFRRRRQAPLSTYFPAPFPPYAPSGPTPVNGGENVYWQLSWLNVPPAPSSYANAELADGARSYWRMDDPSGTTATDLLGKRNGTIVGGVTLGQAGALADGDKAMLFDGTSGKITLAADALSEAFTIEAWVKTSSANAYQAIWSNYSTGVKNTVIFLVSGVQLAVFISDGVGGGSSVSTAFSYAPVNDGALHHVAVVNDGQRTYLVIDSVEVVYFNGVTAQSHGAGGSNTAAIGLSPFVTPFFPGLLDEVVIYDIALSLSQIAAHYVLRTSTNTYSPLFQSPATKYDVYLGQTNPPTQLVSSHQVGQSYALPTLAKGTWYWQIVAINDAGTTAGPVWSMIVDSQTHMFMTVAGQRFEGAYRRDPPLTIHDAYAALPNTGSLVFGQKVLGGEGIRIGLGGLDAPHLIFGGELQTPVQDFDEDILNTKWPCDIVDYTFELNKTRPFGSWVNARPLDIVNDIVPAKFTTLGVQAGLPLVTINFDGTQDFMTCLNALATAVSTTLQTATSDVNYVRDIYLGFADPSNAPDPIDQYNTTLLRTPNIKFTTDLSQLRTRFYGKGHGENTPCDLNANETILPIADTSMFNPAGGRAIAAITADGAQTQQLTYLSVQLGGGGSLVGAGQFPSTPPTLSLLSGTGLGIGLYTYAYTDTTAAGETLPSPLASITTGQMAPPASSLTLTAISGAGLSEGVYGYSYTNVDSLGGETIGAALANVSTYHVAAPASAPTVTPDPGTGNRWPNASHTFLIAVAFLTSSGLTPTALSPTTSFTLNLGDVWDQVVSGSVPADSHIAAAQVYYSSDGGASWTAGSYAGITGTPGTYSSGDQLVFIGTGSAAPTATFFTRVNVANILTGPSGTVSRNLYRTTVGGSQSKFLFQIPDNVSTSYIDSTTDGSLGANIPTTNTTATQQVLVSGIALGASPTTGRKVYRTTAGGAQLKLVTAIANNTATSFTDNVPDGSLGANAPVGDTSGITLQSGIINAGATSVLTASAGPFSSFGGWAISGQNVFRYSSIVGNTLTGVPTAGVGSILTPMLYGSQVVPSPALVGINNWNGITLPMLKGSSVNIFVQRDDLVAQAALGQIEIDENGLPTDGIHQDTFVDERMGEALLIQTCDTLIAKYNKPIIRADFDTRDMKAKSGATVIIDMVFQKLTKGIFDPAIFDPAIFNVGQSVRTPFLIQDVQLSEIDTADNVFPRRRCIATNVLFTLQNLLQGVQVQ